MAPASPASAGTMAKSSGTDRLRRREGVGLRLVPRRRFSFWRDQASGTTTVATGERCCCCPPATRKASRARAIGERGAEGFQNASIRHLQQAPARGLLYRIPLEHRDSEDGASRDRTGDLLLAMQALSQLSYGPASPQYTRCTEDFMPLPPLSRGGGVPLHVRKQRLRRDVGVVGPDDRARLGVGAQLREVGRVAQGLENPP